MTEAKKKSILSGLKLFSAWSGISLIVMVGALRLSAQWVCVTAVDPHIARIADSTSAHSKIDKRFETVEKKQCLQDTNMLYVKYLLEQMATNDQKVRAKNKMYLDREVWR